MEDRINDMIALLDSNYPDFDTSEIEDGYHTFGELYTHRQILFIMLCSIVVAEDRLAVNVGPGGEERVKVTLFNKNHDGKSYPGWFGLKLEIKRKGGWVQISYHIEEQYRDLVERKVGPDLIHEEININYDGHSSEDVVERLKLI